MTAVHKLCLVTDCCGKWTGRRWLLISPFRAQVRCELNDAVKTLEEKSSSASVLEDNIRLLEKKRKERTSSR